MALMAGNSVVVKPSELSPLTAEGGSCSNSGSSRRPLEIVAGDGATGVALIDSQVDKIMFTSSVATGRVAEAAAKHQLPSFLNWAARGDDRPG